MCGAKISVCFKIYKTYIYIYTHTENIRNTIVKQKVNVVRSVLEDSKTKHLQWHGRVQRMVEGRLPTEVMEWSPTGRRKRGRPKLISEEGIRRLMGEQELMEEDWSERGSWRKKII